MRGHGLVYRPLNGSGKPSRVWMLDYSVNGERYRESSGLAVKDHTRDDAFKEMQRRIKDAQDGRPPAPALPQAFQPYVAHHLDQKGKEVHRKTRLPITAQWLKAIRQHLDRAVAFFGADRALRSITRGDLLKWFDWLYQGGNGSFRRLGGGAALQHLHSLQDLLGRACRDGVLPVNPVTLLAKQERPTEQTTEAKWLEVPEAALLLEAAKQYKPKRGDLAVPFMYPLLATLLLTGGRKSEVLGLEIDDISFNLDKVFFRPNKWRPRLKTAGSNRDVPLWPQLRAILQDYVPRRMRMGGLKLGHEAGHLLFPAFDANGQEVRLKEVPRKALNSIAVLSGWKKGDISPKICRDTYGMARGQTLVNGAPCSPFTVRDELGHSDLAMIETRYCKHRGKWPHRSKYVEYRTEQNKVAIRTLRKVRKIAPRILKLVA
jgi:integrase